MNAVHFIETYWAYLTIPLVSGLVGLGTNWLAVKMMLGPQDYIGFGYFGWQGVIPANTSKMARTLVIASVKKVLPQQELLERIDSDELLAAINHRLEPFIEEIVDEAVESTSNYGLSLTSFAWTASPRWLKAQVYKEVRKNLPKVVEEIVDELKNNLAAITDLNELVIRKIIKSRGMLTQIFERIAGDEFKFLTRSGFYFGFPLGIPVMMVWYFFPVWWILPLSGLLVGYLTNKVAMYMLKKPFRPTNMGRWVMHGLFVKRQKEVSAEFGKVFANELITADYLVGAVMREGDSSNKLFKLVEREVNKSIELAQGPIKTLMVLSVGSREYNKMRVRICDRVFEEMTEGDQQSFEYIDRAMDVENTMAKGLSELSPEEFFGILHPIVCEDEWKLILIGAILGLGAGIAQLLLIT